MVNQSTLDEVAQNLEQHGNSQRIKKLVFCASKNIWQNDQAILDKFKFRDLVEELFNLNPTIEHVNYSLSQIVNTLNKPGQYSLVANIILAEMEKLYVIPEEDTGIMYNPSQVEESTALVCEQSPPQAAVSSSLVEELKSYQVKNEYDPFDVRQNIMKYTNPLRAKIVLFAALGHNFTYQKEDLVKLKEEELDNLLWQLFNTCDTSEEFEMKLNNSVFALGDDDENIQAVGAILQATRNLYGSLLSHQSQIPQNYSSPQIVVNSDYQVATTDVGGDDDDVFENDGDNTCQFITPPTIDLRRQNNRNV